MSSSYTIERLTAPVCEADLRELGELLADTVNDGAAISFLAPLSPDAAAAWWQKTIETAHPTAVFLVARDAEGIVGSVQLHPAWAPNQPHRGDIAKLLVHRRTRRSGLGTLLMEEVEAEARRQGLTLLTLDTRRGDAAERLYRRTGWTEVGVIPRYAFNSDGTPHDTVVFFKELG